MAERKGRVLPQLKPGHARIDEPTIMDRALAAEHGAPYVQLAVFAIDVDRVYAEHIEDADLPFGWEVFLVEQYLLGTFSADDPGACDVLEATCLSILAQPPDEQGLGSQLVFAAYDAIGRGLYPKQLERAFSGWRKQPSQLRKELDGLWRMRDTALPQLARHCLDTPLSPPLAAPTRATLERMATGSWGASR